MKKWDGRLEHPDTATIYSRTRDSCLCNRFSEQSSPCTCLERQTSGMRKYISSPKRCLRASHSHALNHGSDQSFTKSVKPVRVSGCHYRELVGSFLIPELFEVYVARCGGGTTQVSLNSVLRSVLARVLVHGFCDSPKLHRSIHVFAIR